MGTILHKVLGTMDNINIDLAEILSNDIYGISLVQDWD